MITNNTHPAPGVQKRIGLRRISQTQWVLVAMIVGITVGYLFPDGANAKGFHATDLQVRCRAWPSF
jgi:ACR3 family arsenite efflux pump ArsB